MKVQRTNTLKSAPRTPQSALYAAALCLLVSAAPLAAAQQIGSASPVTVLLAEAALPDAPSSLRDAPNALPESSSSLDLRRTGQARTATTRASQPMASNTDKYIAPGQTVPRLTAGNKVVLGIKDAISPFSFIGWAAAAGYSQGTDGSPNYGTDGKAFAQRFGAAAARATSEGIFSDSLLSPVLHEDPRYYRMGPGHNFFKRAAYAATRTLITRTDSGKATPNLALLGGNLAGSYLTKAYYPDLNTSNTEVLKTFGGSVGGSALGFAVSEFLSGALNVFHISKPAAD